MKIILQPAFVLHRRLYRETSFLIELFTQDHGKLSVIAKGMRKLRSPLPGLLQPFIPLLVSFSGKGELMTLSHIEANGEVMQLQRDSLFAGFYLNELLMCLLQKWDPHPKLFVIYEKTLKALQAYHLEEKVLRAFEKCFLEELGYGLLPKANTSLQHHILPHQYYRFVPEQGFVLSEETSVPKLTSNLFSGKSLLAIASENWEDKETLQDAKRLTRFMLTPLLGKRQIYSRRLFILPGEENNNEKSNIE